MKFIAGVGFATVIVGASAGRTGYGYESDEPVTSALKPAGYVGAQSLYEPSSTPSPYPLQDDTDESKFNGYNNKGKAYSSVVAAPVYNSYSKAPIYAQTSVLPSSALPSAFRVKHVSSPVASTTAYPSAGGKYYGKGYSSVAVPVVASASFVGYQHPVASQFRQEAPVIATSSIHYQAAIVSAYAPAPPAAKSIESEPEVISPAPVRAHGGYDRRGYIKSAYPSSASSSPVAPSSSSINPAFYGKYQVSSASTISSAVQPSMTTLVRVRSYHAPSQVMSSGFAVYSPHVSSSSAAYSSFKPVKSENAGYNRYAAESKVSSAAYIVQAAPTSTKSYVKSTAYLESPKVQEYEEEDSDSKDSALYRRYAAESKVSSAAYVIQATPTSTKSYVKSTGHFESPKAVKDDYEVEADTPYEV